MDLFDTIRLCNNLNQYLSAPRFWLPCNVVILATYIKKNKTTQDKIEKLITTENARAYLRNIRFYENLYNIPQHTTRMKEGISYSPLTIIDTHNTVNIATDTITSCIKNNINKDDLVCELDNVIGELHDNVCSHGKTFGFSMAQVYRERIDFAISDLGGGFLKVLQRAGVPNINNDLDAIKWCLIKNNTSTKFENREELDDPWRQSVPWDLIGQSPMGNYSFHEEDNHQGLGLDALLELHKKFSDSKLQIASGKIGVEYRNGDIYRTDSNVEWEGVAINLTIPTNKTSCYNTTNNDLDEILNMIG